MCHFHVCVVDGVFEAISGDDKTALAIPSGVNFHPASGLDGAAVAQVQAAARTRILRAFVGRGRIESFDAKEMLACQHSGFPVDAGVCIEAHDRAGLERLPRYCARPPFSMERLRQRGADRVYHCPKPQSGGKQADLVLTPLELIDRIAARVPPPRTHRHRYFGVLAPNSPLRAAVTALAQPAPAQTATEETGTSDSAHGVAQEGKAVGDGAQSPLTPSKPSQSPRQPSVHRRTTCGPC